jgi:inosine triphosphate pyrophosphatase
MHHIKMHHIIFITENVSKFNEIENYIVNKNVGSVSIQMIKPEYELQEIQSLDRHEIVLKKLCDAFNMSKQFLNIQQLKENNKEIWLMVEDTSLCINKMGGFPGPFVKYYLKSLPINVIADANWGSLAQSYVSLAIGKIDNTPELYGRVFDDCLCGNIVSPSGNNGFGYDMIFRPIGLDKTCGDMSINEKEVFNPRTKSFEKILQFLGY